jgi:hypothetical protein
MSILNHLKMEILVILYGSLNVSVPICPKPICPSTDIPVFLLDPDDIAFKDGLYWKC